MVWLGGFDQEGSIHIHSGFVDPASFCKASVSGPFINMYEKGCP